MSVARYIPLGRPPINRRIITVAEVFPKEWRGLSPTAGSPSPGILHQEGEPPKYLDVKANGKLLW